MQCFDNKGYVPPTTYSDSVVRGIFLPAIVYAGMMGRINRIGQALVLFLTIGSVVLSDVILYTLSIYSLGYEIGEYSVRL